MLSNVEQTGSSRASTVTPPCSTNAEGGSHKYEIIQLDGRREGAEVSSIKLNLTEPLNPFSSVPGKSCSSVL